jgi:hypothetical protein
VKIRKIIVPSDGSPLGDELGGCFGEVYEHDRINDTYAVLVRDRSGKLHEVVIGRMNVNFGAKAYRKLCRLGLGEGA